MEIYKSDEFDPGFYGPKKKTRRGYFSIHAFDFRDGGMWDILINELCVTDCRGRPDALNTLAKIVPLVLQNPKAIYAGIRPEYEQDSSKDLSYGLCYQGFPKRSFRGPDELPALPGKCFLVFINAERVAYTWRWESVDPLRPLMPEYCQQRFERKVFSNDTIE